jgi:hypothetical protein
VTQRAAIIAYANNFEPLMLLSPAAMPMATLSDTNTPGLCGIIPSLEDFAHRLRSTRLITRDDLYTDRSGSQMAAEVHSTKLGQC